MRTGVVLLVGLLSLSGLAVAGPNAGGVLLVHANASIVYTSDNQGYCGQSGLAACSLAVTSVPWDPETTTVFYVLAAFPDTAQPRLKAVSWGVQWDDTKLVMVAQGSCADFDVPDGGWPASGTGIGQNFTETRTDLLAEVYWFAGYGYGTESDTTSFVLTPHPLHGGQMADDGMPPFVEEVGDYGVLGLGCPGHSSCPLATDSGEGSTGGETVVKATAQ